jgi:NAD(P)-dependent dehydrogenase (short-subunit alcohol dehydrogenase family)
MVNYLAPFFLSLQLLDLLKMSENAHIINVSSMIHASNIDFENLNGEKHYSGEEAYSLSKLCNVLFTYKLSSLLSHENIRVNALHPGVINTKLLQAAWGAFGGTTEEGAKRILHLVYSNTIQNSSGGYYMNGLKTKSSPISYDKKIQNKLWDISLKLANIE